MLQYFSQTLFAYFFQLNTAQETLRLFTRPPVTPTPQVVVVTGAHRHQHSKAAVASGSLREEIITSQRCLPACSYPHHNHSKSLGDGDVDDLHRLFVELRWRVSDGNMRVEPSKVRCGGRSNWPSAAARRRAASCLAGAGLLEKESFASPA